MNNKVKKVLKLACLEAGKIILKNYGKKKNVKSKGNNDWVTNQDILIEKKIIQKTMHCAGVRTLIYSQKS